MMYVKNQITEDQVHVGNAAYDTRSCAILQTISFAV